MIILLLFKAISNSSGSLIADKYNLKVSVSQPYFQNITPSFTCPLGFVPYCTKPHSQITVYRGGKNMEISYEMPSQEQNALEKDSSSKFWYKPVLPSIFWKRNKRLFPDTGGKTQEWVLKQSKMLRKIIITVDEHTL